MPPLGPASEVILKSGQKITGKIVARTDKYIKIDTGIGIAVTYYTDEINKIQEEQKVLSPPPSVTSSLSDPYIPGWQLVWHDEFDGSEVDPNKWTFEIGNGDNGWSNGQMDYATSRPENVDIQDGQMVLTVRQEEYQGFHYTSSRMVTRDKLDFKYGRIEIRAKALATPGVGLAFWLLGSNYRDPAWTWPKCGEIDVLEIEGRDPGRVLGTAHFEENGSHHMSQGSYRLPDGEKFSDDYHTFAIEWDENQIVWYVDSAKINTFDISRPFDGQQPFNNNFYLVLNTAVGGHFWREPDDTSVFPATAYVQWVRIYKKA